MDTLAVIMGVSDVDPFIMGLTQAAGTLTPVKVAAGAILIAAASNNVVKGIYAYSLSDRKTGRLSLTFLLSLAAGGSGSADLVLVAGRRVSKLASQRTGGAAIEEIDRAFNKKLHVCTKCAYNGV